MRLECDPLDGTEAHEILVYLCLQIFSDEGVRGFYRGCTTNLLRTTPAAALTFTSFELIARQLRELGHRQRLREAEKAAHTK